MSSHSILCPFCCNVSSFYQHPDVDVPPRKPNQSLVSFAKFQTSASGKASGGSRLPQHSTLPIDCLLTHTEMHNGSSEKRGRRKKNTQVALVEKIRVHLNDKFSSQVLSPSSVLGSSQRSVVSHRRVGGFSDSSFLGLYSVDKVSSEFSFSLPRLVVFGKHIKSVGRRVGIDFSEPRNSECGGAKTHSHFPTHRIRELRNSSLECRRRPSVRTEDEEEKRRGLVVR